jgi:hypothetical protein
MPTFFLTHHFPKNFQSSPVSAEAATAWFERLGPNLAGRGNPASETRRLGDCSNGPERAVAFTVISTDDLEAAVALAEALAAPGKRRRCRGPGADYGDTDFSSFGLSAHH